MAQRMRDRQAYAFMSESEKEAHRLKKKEAYAWKKRLMTESQKGEESETVRAQQHIQVATTSSDDTLQSNHPRNQDGELVEEVNAGSATPRAARSQQEVQLATTSGLNSSRQYEDLVAEVYTDSTASRKEARQMQVRRTYTRMSTSEKEARRLKKREAYVRKKSLMSETQKEARRLKMREAYARKRSSLTESQKEAERVRIRQYRAVRAQQQIQTARASSANATLQPNSSRHQDDEVVTEHYLGSMDVPCLFCQALHFRNEPRKSCCHDGKVVHKPAQNFPVILKDLLSNSSNPNFVKFQEQIRSYNSALSFASMGGHIDIPKGRGPFCFRVHGQIYHNTSHLHPSSDGVRKYAQLYVVDPNEANLARLAQPPNRCCDPKIMTDLDQIIRQCNPYAKLFRTLAEVEKEENQKAADQGISPPQVSLIFKRQNNPDQRRYNLPTTDDIAMVFRNREGEPPFQRDLQVYPRPSAGVSTQIQLSILSSHLDPMTYPLIYPCGEPGWEPNLTANNLRGRSSNISMLQWKVAQTAVRPHFSPLICAGKLFQQWVVDSYLQVEANNLNFIKTQQPRLRSDSYQGLMDHFNDPAADRPAGRQIILPSTFQGSPRNMREKYQDAMAIVGKYGKPDIFCTMTCNPKWTEIVDNLLPGQSPSSRPDLISRVFSLKLNELIVDITKKGIFGPCVAYVGTLEFQKRGLPHCHLLIILNQSHKITTAQQIDQLVSAELPDKTTQPRLFEIVTRTNVHGPCGAANPNAPCMLDGKCSKGFPKECQSKTTANVNGYPLYQRRIVAPVKVGNFDVDNSWIVPYSKKLTLKFDCHINVEVCTSVKSVKYIYKYIYKGYSCAQITVGEIQTIDEIAAYMDSRYVSAPEGMWRLHENKMHHKSHAVYRLAVHLPNFQQVFFHQGREMEAFLNSDTKNTHLTAWFELNKQCPDAQNYHYYEIPYHYTFNKSNGTWCKRKKFDKIIPRMYTVSPKDVERFHLRLLLLHVKGPQNWEDLKSFGGTEYPTFREAAIARNLIEDDSEWVRCLEEAVATQMPRQLRQLFSFIVIFNHPKNPLELFNLFKKDFVEDYIRFYPEQIATNKAMWDIEKLLTAHGLSCVKVGLSDKSPNPEDSPLPEFDRENEALQAENLIVTLNADQKLAFSEIISAVESPYMKSKFFFLDGPGGSGKTYLYNCLMSYLRGKDKVVLPFATTGIAADLLKGGRTAHSGFKLPVPLTDTSTSSIRPNSAEARIIKESALIIVDEASMLSKDGLRCMDILLKDLTGDSRPFGGKAILLGGDFRQTSNVIPRGSNADVIEACIKSSPLWQYVKILSLKNNMRCHGNDYFNQWLLKIGDGILTNDVGLEPSLIEIPSTYIENGDITTKVYGERVQMTNDDVTKRIILTPKNKDAQKLNNEILNLIEGEVVVYRSADSVEATEDGAADTNYPTEFLNSLTPSGMPPHELKLKKGAVVMLLRNLYPQKGLLNGTRIIVKQLYRNFIRGEIVTGSNMGENVVIPRININLTDSTLPFTLRRRQFPLSLAFAMTINKSQGQSFEKVGLFLPEPVFAHGQLYVALSRCRNEAELAIKIVSNPGKQGQLIPENEKFYTKNVVLQDLLM